MYRVITLVLVMWECNGQVIPSKSRTIDGDYNNVNTDGSFDFGYANKDRGASYHVSRGNAALAVGGRFGSRDPATGVVKETVYTAGPRGFRAKGPNIHRKMDIDQRPRGPIGNSDDPYFDPSEDPSYSFRLKTNTYSKEEDADILGDVKGHYSYIDDIGERHDVSYVAGRHTGFHVTNAVPDDPASLPSHYYNAPLVRGEHRQRGKMSVQRGLDGSYRFISAGPDQRRTESSDANGNVRGSYTFLDDKGVQRTVHYIAGPGIGYRIVKNGKDPYIPSYFPTIPSAYDPEVALESNGHISPVETEDDIFKGPDGTSASGHVKPNPFSSSKDKKPKPDEGSSMVDDEDGPGYPSSTLKPPPIASTPGTIPIRPTKKPFIPYKPTSSPRPSFDSSGNGVDSGSNGNRGNGYNYKPPKNGYDYKPPKNGFRDNNGGRSGSSRPSDDKFVPNGDKSIPNEEKYGENTYKYKSSADKYVPNSDKYGPNAETYGPNTDKYGPNKGNLGPEVGIKFNLDTSNPGSTIIRNIGEDLFSIPPGVAVRAHVQSIDLYPFGSKRLTPGEAIEKVKS